jgi:hypothetical protein
MTPQTPDLKKFDLSPGAAAALKGQQERLG